MACRQEKQSVEALRKPLVDRKDHESNHSVLLLLDLFNSSSLMINDPSIVILAYNIIINQIRANCPMTTLKSTEVSPHGRI